MHKFNGWLETEQHWQQTPKLIIFCQSHRQCRELHVHAAFDDVLGQDLITHIAMYHSYTEEKRKEKVMQDFTEADSFIRVLVAPVAFGVGVHVEELQSCVTLWPST